MMKTEVGEIGHYIRERIVPRAVLFFTGEALDEDSDYDEDDEDDDDDDEDGSGSETFFLKPCRNLVFYFRPVRKLVNCWHFALNSVKHFFETLQKSRFLLQTCQKIG